MNRYEISTFCRNCWRRCSVAIPVGTTVEEFLEQEPCRTCGCCCLVHETD